MPVEPWAATPGSFEVVGGGRSTVVQRHDFQVRTGILEGDEDRADAHPKTKAMFRSPEQDRTGASADTHAKKLGRLCVLASGYSGKAFDKFVGEALQSVPVRDARTAIYRNASDHARSLASKVPAADDGRPGSVPADGIHPKILQSVGKSWTTERCDHASSSGSRGPAGGLGAGTAERR